jgi:hypothetical protein
MRAGLVGAIPVPVYLVPLLLLAALYDKFPLHRTQVFRNLIP